MKENIEGKNKHILKQKKYCSGCGQTKDRSEFSIANKERGYVRSRCKECLNIQAKEYRLKNKDLIREKMKKYYQDHREYIIQKQKEYYIKKSIEEVKQKLKNN